MIFTLDPQRKTRGPNVGSGSDHSGYRAEKEHNPMPASNTASLHLRGCCVPLLVMLSALGWDALCFGLTHFPWSHVVTLQMSGKYSILKRLLSPRTTKVKLPLSLEISSGAWMPCYSKASQSCWEWPSRNLFSLQEVSPPKPFHFLLPIYADQKGGFI